MGKIIFCPYIKPNPTYGVGFFMAKFLVFSWFIINFDIMLVLNRNRLLSQIQLSNKNGVYYETSNIIIYVNV